VGVTRPLALTDLPVRGDLRTADLSRALGRRWRKDNPDFWRRLSPLGLDTRRATEEEVQVTRQLADPEDEAFVERLRRLRQADLEEARRDAAALSTASAGQDLRSSAINGSIDDREDDVEEEPWQ
jgi:hypothetical protein